MTYSLAELCICAGADMFKGDGEMMTTLIGVLPRISGGLAKLSFEPGLMMTEGEAYLVSEPVPVGPRGDYKPKIEGIMTYERVFDIIGRGLRHCFVGPVQVDRFGQMNISIIGDYAAPKVALLGARGFPGNTINNVNSMFIPSHNVKACVAGEVDMVSSVGYNPARWPDGKKPPYLELRRIITNLCVMDFEGVDNAIRVRSLHPGVGVDEVRDNTGFDLECPDDIPATKAPTDKQLELIQWLDPHNLRASVFKDNPPGVRSSA